MNNGTGIMLGLVAALCWGVADFCARGSSRAGGTFLTLFCVQIIGIAGMLLLNQPLDLISFAHATPGAVTLAVIINLMILCGAALLYHAFSVGTLALISPIAASFAAITAALSLLTGERANPVQLVGFVVTVAGVVLTSTDFASTTAIARKDDQKTNAFAHYRRPAPGVVETLIAVLIFGVGFWALRYPIAVLGGTTTIYIAKVADMAALMLTALLGLAIYQFRIRHKGIASDNAPWYVMRMPARSFWPWVIPFALLDTAANIAYSLGLAVSLTAIVSVVSSLFSAVTVLMACIFLRERLVRWQWVGVGAILVGIALVSV
ncbi:MAG TPA: EamA family transporter [Ktedonobacterales bacterium]|nr:EamA family transporter [Ktedonobacterales bacterium]